MAGQLTIDTLKASSGVLATQNGMTGIAKAWVNFDGSTASIRGSFNVTSITKNASGDYTVNFTTAMPNANYSVTAMTMRNISPQAADPIIATSYNSTVYGDVFTTGSTRIKTHYYNGTLLDPLAVTVSVLSA